MAAAAMFPNARGVICMVAVFIFSFPFAFACSNYAFLLLLSSIILLFFSWKRKKYDKKAKIKLNTLDKAKAKS